MKKTTKTVGEPHDRLTRMGNEVLEAILVHPEYAPNVRAIVFLTDGDRSGIGVQGYDEDLTEAVTDLFIHLKAMFAAMGKELSLFPIEPNDPSTS